MKPIYRNSISFALIAAAVVSFIIFEEQLPSVDLSILDPTTVFGVLGYISVIMLVVEQCIEIFVFDPNKMQKEKDRRRVQEIEALLDEVLDPIMDIEMEVEKMEDPEQMEEVEMEKEAEPIKRYSRRQIQLLEKESDRLREKLKTQGEQRQKKVQLVSFIIGLIISFSGIRVLSGTLFNAENILFGFQNTLIQSIDIVLTAGIISGGSDRVHSLIKRAKGALSPYAG